jgi:hypothetical protein
VTKLVETAVLGVWLGTGWSAHMWAYGVDSTAMLNIFNAFAFAETPTGVVMTSRDPQRLGLVRDSAWAPHVACYVQGLGLVDVFQRTHVQEAQVPTKPGASVAGGELWVEQGAAADAEGPADVTFLLANGTALARIYAEISEVPEATLIDRCSRLTVDWRAA